MAVPPLLEHPHVDLPPPLSSSSYYATDGSESAVTQSQTNAMRFMSSNTMRTGGAVLIHPTRPETAMQGLWESTHYRRHQEQGDGDDEDGGEEGGGDGDDDDEDDARVVDDPNAGGRAIPLIMTEHVTPSRKFPTDPRAPWSEVGDIVFSVGYARPRGDPTDNANLRSVSAINYALQAEYTTALMSGPVLRKYVGDPVGAVARVTRLPDRPPMNVHAVTTSSYQRQHLVVRGRCRIRNLTLSSLYRPLRTPLQLPPSVSLSDAAASHYHTRSVIGEETRALGPTAATSFLWLVLQKVEDLLYTHQVEDAAATTTAATTTTATTTTTANANIDTKHSSSSSMPPPPPPPPPPLPRSAVTAPSATSAQPRHADLMKRAALEQQARLEQRARTAPPPPAQGPAGSSPSPAATLGKRRRDAKEEEGEDNGDGVGPGRRAPPLTAATKVRKTTTTETTTAEEDEPSPPPPPPIGVTNGEEPRRRRRPNNKIWQFVSYLTPSAEPPRHLRHRVGDEAPAAMYCIAVILHMDAITNADSPATQFRADSYTHPTRQNWNHYAESIPYLDVMMMLKGGSA